MIDMQFNDIADIVLYSIIWWFICRDMNTPINVLTGLDYWLDNLMCNVPEVAMCFHMEGIVQVHVQSSIFRVAQFL